MISIFGGGGMTFFVFGEGLACFGGKEDFFFFLDERAKRVKKKKERKRRRQMGRKGGEEKKTRKRNEWREGAKNIGKGEKNEKIVNNEKKRGRRKCRMERSQKTLEEEKGENG